MLAGAFDELGKKDGLTRRAMYDSVKPLMESYKKSSKREIPGQMSLFDTTKDEDVIRELMEIEVTTLTPLDALNTLYKLQNKLKNRWTNL